MQSKAKTVAEYLNDLPADRRTQIEIVRQVILANLDADYAEGIQYGMIGYFVPHSIYPAGYHCDPKQPLPFAGLASQKGYMSLYLMCVYGNHDKTKWFQDEWAKTGKKLDMGKSCIRFQRAEDLALDVIAKAVALVPARKYVQYVQEARSAYAATKAAKKAPKKTANLAKKAIKKPLKLAKKAPRKRK